MRSVIAITFALSTLAPALYAAQVSGEAVYQQRCAACHDSANPRVPPRDELKKLSVTRILRALDFGEMNNVASKLRQDEREAVASYLGVPGGNVQFPAKAYCADRTVRLTGHGKTEWNGWSPALTNTRYQPGDAEAVCVFQPRRKRSGDRRNVLLPRVAQVQITHNKRRKVYAPRRRWQNRALPVKRG